MSTEECLAVENVEPEKSAVRADLSKITNVTTHLSDDLSTLNCVMRDKDGQNVTFKTTLPTGPKVRVIRQIIEIVHDDEDRKRAQRTEAVCAFADCLIDRLCRIHEATGQLEVQQRCECLIEAIGGSVGHKCPYSQLKNYVQEIDELEQVALQSVQDESMNAQRWSNAAEQELESGLESVDVQLRDFQDLVGLVQNQLQDLVGMVGLDGQMVQVNDDKLSVVQEAVNRTMLSIQQFLEEQPRREHMLALNSYLDQMQNFISQGDEQGLVQTVIEVNKYIQNVSTQE